MTDDDLVKLIARLGVEHCYLAPSDVVLARDYLSSMQIPIGPDLTEMVSRAIMRVEIGEDMYKQSSDEWELWKPEATAAIAVLVRIFIDKSGMDDYKNITDLTTPLDKDNNLNFIQLLDYAAVQYHNDVADQLTKLRDRLGKENLYTEEWNALISAIHDQKIDAWRRDGRKLSPDNHAEE